MHLAAQNVQSYLSNYNKLDGFNFRFKPYIA